MTSFTTAQDVTEQIVLPALGEFAGSFDVEAITAAIYEWQDGRIVIIAEGDDFWAIVAQHALPQPPTVDVIG